MHLCTPPRQKPPCGQHHETKNRNNGEAKGSLDGGAHALCSERSRSATAAGEPSRDEAREQRISQTVENQKRRRLLAGASGFGFHGQGRLFSDFNQSRISPNRLESGERVPSISIMSARSPERSFVTLLTASTK